MKLIIILIVLLAGYCQAQPIDTDNMYFDFKSNEIVYYEIVTDYFACRIIPQNPVALDTYKWYRITKKYTPQKSVRLTIKYWTLNLKSKGKK